jgi:putative Ca2+/H+ antiporter (TMEM165/GDT1 family)
MNSLSWMLYFAGVCGNIQGVLIGAAIVAGLAAIFSTLAFCLTTEDYNETEHTLFGKAMKYAWPACAASALLASIIPSERTFYLIAASEMGDRALQTQTGKKAIAAVNRYLDTIGEAVPSPK